MSDSIENRATDEELSPADEAPESVPPKAWLTLVAFAGFVVLFLTCANQFLFN